MNKRLYKPSEIARLGLITTLAGSANYQTNYQFILRLIKEGELAARNYGTKDRSYWLVSKGEIQRYNKSINK